MKDGYSFDANDEASQKTYWNMAEAYQEIFKRCGLNFKMVEADTGVMGGSLSHEFMVFADAGEDEIFSCPECGYAANRELALRQCPRLDSKPQPGPEPVRTPSLKSVEEVSQFLGVDPRQLIKTLIYFVDGKAVAVLCRGDVQINESKLCKYLEVASVELANEEIVRNVTGSPMGFAGPVALKGVRIIADLSLKNLRDGVAGANEVDTHLIHVDLERDSSIESYQDIGYAQKGDLCAKCQAPFNLFRGIEVGHVFKLGTKYSLKLGAQFLNEQGIQAPCVMGCYGIGVSRTLAAFVEQNSTEEGILWNRALAPFEVLLLPVLMEVSEVREVAEKFYADLKKIGLDVLLDDRDERPGVKFKDSDLIGFPVQVTLGQKLLKERKIEVQLKAQRKTELIPLENAIKSIEGILSQVP
jgi:prolyl-tRNA synthetase